MSVPTTPVPVHGFVAVLTKGTAGGPDAPSRIRTAPAELPHRFRSQDGRLDVAVASPITLSPGNTGAFLVGDAAEWKDNHDGSCMANAVLVTFDLDSTHLRVIGSLVGLPPVFLYETAELLVIASSVWLLRYAQGVTLALDEQGVAELMTIGYPIYNRTLFEHVSLLPAGTAMTVSAASLAAGLGGAIETVWSPKAPSTPLDWPEYTQLQVETFRHAMRGIDMSHSVLSLTGGMDTRAILAEMGALGVTMPSCTITGANARSLDIQAARVLSNAYHLPHTTIALGEAFLADLPRYTVDASRLSGGLSSLQQAHEVYFMEQIRGLGTHRISGYLGNQVGRQGVEGISFRNVDTAVLPGSLASRVEETRQSHWLTHAVAASGHPLARVLIQEEVPYSSVGNFTVGHHFLIQQSPYANRTLIENALHAPTRTSFDPSRARWRDLRHRFLGPPEARSFQRQVIRAAGGTVANYPINWGWLGKGGVSIPGIARGFGALADAFAARKGRLSGVARAGVKIFGTHETHDIYRTHYWFDTSLREFANDVLRSADVMQSPYFNGRTLVTRLDEHVSGTQPHYDTLMTALDVALAQRLGTNPV